MHLSIDHPYLALIHLNWLYQHVPHQLQGLYEASELEVYLNRVTQEAQQRINALMNQGGIALVDAQKQVTHELLAKAKDRLTSEELADYHELDLLQLTPEQKTIYGGVYRKIERWYRTFQFTLPQKHQVYYRNRNEYRSVVQRKWGWGVYNRRSIEVLGIDDAKITLHKATNCTLLVALRNGDANESRPPLFAIEEVFIKPIDFFDTQMKLECMGSFWVRFANKCYRFREGDAFVVDQEDLTTDTWQTQL